ncbi:MAG: hypothetical protein Q9211_003303 [Gyalolechia sp. 1 TL-2023]
MCMQVSCLILRQLKEITGPESVPFVICDWALQDLPFNTLPKLNDPAYSSFHSPDPVMTPTHYPLTTTTTSTSLPHPATRPISFHAPSTSISKTIPHTPTMLTGTACSLRSTSTRSCHPSPIPASEEMYTPNTPNALSVTEMVTVPPCPRPEADGRSVGVPSTAAAPVVFRNRPRTANAGGWLFAGWI